MQFHSFKIPEQPRLKLVTEYAESLLRKTEDITPVINITEATGRKETPRTTIFMPRQPEAYMKPNKYDFF